MTPQEAISTFKEWIERDKKIEYADRDENIEIYKTAIKALEQQPCEDAISREVVKEMLTEEWTKYMPMELDINLSFILDKISVLPSVTPKAKWIPVSERLPKDFGTYLITLKSGDVCLCDFDPDFLGDRVSLGVVATAWMPLKLYKTESER